MLKEIFVVKENRLMVSTLDGENTDILFVSEND